jgi:hypothetical protein
MTPQPPVVVIPTDQKSQFVGVHWDRRRRKWRTQVSINKKAVNAGYFVTEEDAARAFDERAGALGRPVNFPKEGQEQAIKRGTRGEESHYVGVDWHVSVSKWRAQIKPENSSLKHLGYYKTEKAAARAYDRRARKLGRPLNFPRQDEVKSLKRATSSFLGTHWNGKKWESIMDESGSRTHLGSFKSEAEAARAYDDHLATECGSARVNFPGEVAWELRKARVGFTSNFVGVSQKKNGLWEVKIRVGNENVRVGDILNEEDAARKYDELAAPLGRPVNFPKEGQTQANKRGSSSKFRGVSLDKRSNKWVASITIAGERAHLGTFEIEEDAARAFDERAASLGRPVNFVE